MTDTATPAPADATATPTERRGRGILEADVKHLCDEFIVGNFTLPEGDFLTPHTIAKTLKEQDNLDKPPSSGAISSILKRWRAIGFAVVNEKPFAFLDYTDAGRSEGLAALKAAAGETKRTERAAIKAAEKAAAAPAPAAEATNTDAAVELTSTDTGDDDLAPVAATA